VVGTDALGNRCLGKTESVAGKPAYSYYVSLIRQRVEAEQQKQASEGAEPKRRPSPAARGRRPATPEELKRFNKYSVEQIEQMITALEQELDAIKERFGDADVYRNPESLTELQRTFDAKTAELDLLYRAYERRAG
jgi:hypothetical protein